MDEGIEKGISIYFGACLHIADDMHIQFIYSFLKQIFLTTQAFHSAEWKRRMNRHRMIKKKKNTVQ
jgi:hypothetical protein